MTALLNEKEKEIHSDRKKLKRVQGKTEATEEAAKYSEHKMHCMTLHLDITRPKPQEQSQVQRNERFG